MADSRNVQNCLRWISDEERVHLTSEYGRNKKSVDDALAEQKTRDEVVKDYSKEVRAVRQDKVTNAYDDLKTVSGKRLSCLEDISKIASIEDLLGALTVEFAEKASGLVASECSKSSDIPPSQGNGVKASAQNCILAMRENWAWISKLVKCTDVHLQHSSDYHQFFHEVKEYEQWMPAELRQAQEKFRLATDSEGEKREADRMMLDLKELLTMFLHWHGKLDKLFEKSKTIIPVNLRTKKIPYFRPVHSLCDYKTKDIGVREGEELLLTDNGDMQNWQVRTATNEETLVPSVICVIPGPSPEAIEAAVKLRFQLLSVWSLNTKRMGKSLILFNILVLHDWLDDELKWLKAMTRDEKEEVRRVMTFIQETLEPYWKDYEGYKELCTRFDNMRDIIKKDGKPGDRDQVQSQDLIDKLHAIEEMLKRYGDFWKHWDSWRIMVETSKNPDYQLVSERWEELKYIPIDELRRMWQNGLHFSDRDKMDFEEWMEMMRKRWANRIVTMNDGELNETTEVETTTTEEISTAEQEEKRTFVITGVVDPRSNEEVSMHQAVMLGIINSEEGLYVNPTTRETLPIPVAMNAGFIKVEFTTSKKSAETKKDIGLVTIKTQKESRPYTVKAVIDAKSDARLSVEEAVKKGILNEKKGIYKNTRDNTEMPLADALDSGLLAVEFDDSVEVAEPEIVTKTYAIHGVVDQRKKEKVPFAQAVRSGILDKETGAYFHNVNRESIYVGEAIMKGFIKATIVKDPSKLDIDPENKMVIEKVQNIRKKLIGPMKALAALKKAAAASE